MRQIYLDYNATTPVAPSVFEAMRPLLTEHFGNPSSLHAFGAAAHQIVEEARERVAELLGARSDEIYFTSGGTESNNLAIAGALMSETGFRGHLITSAIEHPAVSEPAAWLQRMGCSLTVLPTDSLGRVNPADVKAALRPDTVLVTIMHANNEIGTVQPIQEISQICREADVMLHTDAAQSLGKIRAQVDELGVDMLTLAGHKIYAPKGIGALYVRRGTQLHPFMRGAGHEQGLRPGTENVASIAGLAQSARLAMRSVEENTTRLASLTTRLWDTLREGVRGLSLNGPPTDRLPNTLSVNFPHVWGQQLLDQAAEVCASTGSACHSGSSTLSATLRAIGLDPETARGTIRLSLGWNTSEEEIDRAASLLIHAWESLNRAT
ncbi:MAG: cysteine desulfurase [Planctomycetales bacterium]|nr:cysteine desulfurase [Planctomycetales bacterium]